MSEVRRGLREGRITVNGRVFSPGLRVSGGEAVSLAEFVFRTEWVPEPDEKARCATVRLYEDVHLLALAKPSGLPTLPLRPRERGTLLGAAVAWSPSVATAGPPLEGGVVHRLDTGTSGVVLAAKDLKTRRLLRDQFRSHQILKRYLAWVFDPDQRLPKQGTVSMDVQQQAPHRVRLVPKGGGLAAETRYRFVDRRPGGLVLVEAETRTGRRHQVRAHLAHAGAPMLGDPLYGPDDPLRRRSRLALHAIAVTLPDGRVFEAAPGPEFTRLGHVGSCALS